MGTENKFFRGVLKILLIFALLLAVPFLIDMILVLSIEKNKGKAFEVEVKDGVIPEDWEPYLEIIPGKYSVVIQDIDIRKSTHRPRRTIIPIPDIEKVEEVVSVDVKAKIIKRAPELFYSGNENIIELALLDQDGITIGYLQSDSTLTRQIRNAMQTPDLDFIIHFSGNIPYRKYLAKERPRLTGAWSASDDKGSFDAKMWSRENEKRRIEIEDNIKQIEEWLSTQKP